MTLTLTTGDGQDLLRATCNDPKVGNISWPLADLNQKGYDDACRLVGNAAIMLISRVDVSPHPALSKPIAPDVSQPAQDDR
jgi:hypothetical protein